MLQPFISFIMILNSYPFSQKVCSHTLLSENQMQLQTKNVFRLKQQINLPLLSHLLSSAFSGSSSPTLPAGFLTYRSTLLPNLLTWISHATAAFENLRHMTSLPAYSDRIAQDSHLIPYYPRNYNRFEALETLSKPSITKEPLDVKFLSENSLA